MPAIDWLGPVLGLAETAAATAVGLYQWRLPHRAQALARGHRRTPRPRVHGHAYRDPRGPAGEFELVIGTRSDVVSTDVAQLLARLGHTERELITRARKAMRA